MSKSSIAINRKYDSIDLMKFIASIFVVALHTDVFYDINRNLYVLVCNGLSRLAVPLFFISSAYFLYLPEQESQIKKRQVKYIKRLATLYLVWFIIYLPITIYNRIYLSKFSLLETLFRYFRSLLFSGGFSGAWFLSSCIFCVLVFNMIDNNKYIGGGKMCIISFIIYIFCVITSSYSKIIDILHLQNEYYIYELLFCQPYLSIIAGIPYFYLGRYLVKNQKNMISKEYSIIVFILYITEVIMVNHFNLGKPINHYFLLGPCAYIIFINIKECTLYIPHAIILRKMSLVIYLSQFLWIFMIEFIEWLFRVSLTQTEKFCCIILLCIITYISLSVLCEYRSLKWLRYLI